jgi:nucleoid DNA-binding protein
MVEKQLKKLLYRFDCVILPDFGAFLAKNKPSQYHKNTQVFYPPRRQLNFNAQLKSDDGLLIKSISKTHGISYDQAQHEVKSFVEDLKSTLHQEKNVKLDQLGSFELTANQILRFYPDNNSLRKDTFGLKPLQVDQLESVKNLKENESSAKETGVIQLEKDTNVAKNDVSHSFLKYASIGIIAIAITGLLGYILFQNQNLIQANNNTSVKKTDIKNKLQKANFTLQESFPALTLKIKSEKPKAVKKKFHVIAGAFRYKENAIKKVNQLQKKGFDSKLLGQNEYGLHQVCFLSFSSRKKALENLKKIKRKENQGAWLLVKEF